MYKELQYLHQSMPRFFPSLRASDGDIQGWYEHTQNKAKFVNLFDIMLSNFCGKGRHVMCDSVYMGENMAQVSRKIYKNINMVGIIQDNCTGAPMATYLKANRMMKKRTANIKCANTIHNNH